MSNFFKSIMAGIAIGIGGWAFLASDNKLVGSILFSIGLLLVCTMGYNLYTGKICKAFTIGGPKFILFPWMLLGNFFGTFIVAMLTRAGRPLLIDKAAAVCSAKLSEGLAVIPLAIMCNVMIYYAVTSYGENPHQLGKYLGIILGVTIFVFCGFEHCVANAYYFFVAGFSMEHIPFLILNVLGNTIGGIVIYRLDTLSKINY